MSAGPMSIASAIMHDTAPTIASPTQPRRQQRSSGARRGGRSRGRAAGDSTSSESSESSLVAGSRMGDCCIAIPDRGAGSPVIAPRAASNGAAMLETLASVIGFVRLSTIKLRSLWRDDKQRVASSPKGI